MRGCHLTIKQQRKLNSTLAIVYHFDNFPDDLRDGRGISAERDVGRQDGLAVLAVVVRRDGETVDRRHRLLQGPAEPHGVRRDQGEAKVFRRGKKGSEVELMLIVDSLSIKVKFVRKAMFISGRRCLTLRSTNLKWYRLMRCFKSVVALVWKSHITSEYV